MTIGPIHRSTFATQPENLAPDPTGRRLDPTAAFMSAMTAASNSWNFQWITKGVKWTPALLATQPPTTTGKEIQRVHLDTSEVEVWCAPDSVGDPVPECSGQKHP